MEYSQLIRNRYSVRSFSRRAVDETSLAAILEAARVAPTAANRQPQRILVLQDAASLERLKTCTPYTFDAPMALIVCFNREEAWVRPYDNQNAGFIDAAIIGTHIMLAAADAGLGSTWVGHFDPAALRAAYAIPDTLEPVAIFPVGHPAPEAKPAHLHEKRRPLQETVAYEKF